MFHNARLEAQRLGKIGVIAANEHRHGLGRAGESSTMSTAAGTG